MRARASQGMYSVKLMPHHIGLCPNVLQNTVQMPYPQLAVLGSDGRFHIGIGEEQGREMAGSRTPMSRWMAAWRKPLCHCGKTRRSRKGAVWCMVSPPAVQGFCGAAVSRGNTGRAGQPEGKVQKQDCCRSAAGDRKGRVTTAGAGRQVRRPKNDRGKEGAPSFPRKQRDVGPCLQRGRHQAQQT